MTDCEYFAVDRNQQLTTTPTEHDAALAGQLASPRLRRLVHMSIGLSDESVDLLNSMSARLRAAAGLTPRDPLDEH
ncbi:hypothetical protein [Nocardia sp. CNY236]|uniref:hypothetical protein n=1 Tax=Nocardia sp. CNY236 TaxID=1169152 RepID=UPI0012DC28B2|nr:hypothetical protein [Nocardia sp. CNY236]